MWSKLAIILENLKNKKKKRTFVFPFRQETRAEDKCAAVTTVVRNYTSFIWSTGVSFMSAFNCLKSPHLPSSSYPAFSILLSSLTSTRGKSAAWS